MMRAPPARSGRRRVDGELEDPAVMKHPSRVSLRRHHDAMHAIAGSQQDLARLRARNDLDLRLARFVADDDGAVSSDRDAPRTIPPLDIKDAIGHRSASPLLERCPRINGRRGR